jgi:very-short-patch-repair endonuclease
MKIFNRPEQKSFRSALRRNQTEPEQRLWARLRSKQFGVKFRRQHGVGRYIVDFYCAELGLIIELDGDSHYQEGAPAYDAVRDEFMRRLGLRVLRFTNQDVMQQLDAVLEKIAHAVGVDAV